MMPQMSIQARKELFRNGREHYLKASKPQKSVILTEIGVLTGLHREHIITVLRASAVESNAIRRKRKKSYSQETEDALVKVWELSNRVCSKRLVPFLGSFCAVLQKHGHLNITDSVRDDLLRLSPATIDRCLAPLRNLEDQKKRRFRHRSPGIRRQIPIRTQTGHSSGKN
jgi:hypothetical protein